MTADENRSMSFAAFQGENIHQGTEMHSIHNWNMKEEFINKHNPSPTSLQTKSSLETHIPPSGTAIRLMECFFQYISHSFVCSMSVTLVHPYSCYLFFQTMACYSKQHCTVILILTPPPHFHLPSLRFSQSHICVT